MLSGLRKEEILFYFVCLRRKRFEGKEKNFSRTTLTLVLLLVEFSIFDQVRIQIVVTGSERQKKKRVLVSMELGSWRYPGLNPY